MAWQIRDTDKYESGRWDAQIGDWVSVCTSCGNDINGCSWSGRCRRCHEARLLPPESFEDEYLSPYNEITGADY
ncbi:hypothetical protein [Kribbella catacumbae]|uniref:hypothetical protein n=1 Tax=Kribbella catacumbae TaxID=460086 RepID=UPI00036FAA86|nr:hypothetical protein [Kribbella catacumbae]